MSRTPLDARGFVTAREAFYSVGLLKFTTSIAHVFGKCFVDGMRRRTIGAGTIRAS